MSANAPAAKASESAEGSAGAARGAGLSHAQAVVLMVLVTLLWSTAGVVTRHLEQARSWEVTFWRSFFTVLTGGALVISALLFNEWFGWRQNRA